MNLPDLNGPVEELDIIGDEGRESTARSGIGVNDDSDKDASDGGTTYGSGDLPARQALRSRCSCATCATTHSSRERRRSS